MQLRSLLREDDAASSVVGIVLVVAITVILAAVIASFVLGLGDQVSDTAPQASFSIDWEGKTGTPDVVTISHRGGDTLDAGNLYLRGQYGGGAGSFDIPWTDAAEYADGSGVTSGNSIVLGDTASADVGDDDIASDGEVDIVWEGVDGDTSATLGEWDGPDA